MRFECDACGLSGCDLPDGVDPEFIFDRIGSGTYCVTCNPEDGWVP